MNKTEQDFANIWERIAACAGQEFWKIGGEPFIYRVVGNLVYPSPTDYHISKNDFKKIYEFGHVEGPGKIRDIVRGPSYVWAILNDKRILGG